KSAKKKKDNGYGLTPGSTPYPEWPHPTSEECHEVTRLLETIHGKVQMPKAIPTPSLEVAGCGEVPSVLDALIRTRLSAATTGANSSRAFKGLVDTFGVLKEGIGKGSVNWEAVRLADTKAVFNAIKSGGLADVKSKDIKSILQMVHDENQARREDLIKENGDPPPGAENESKSERDAEVARADSHVLSLDHLHALPSEDAFNQLVKYPGIGPKTASCVLLFCLQRPSFAVDTHVFRLCRYLNWVPPDKATRNSTYAHCEVRVPDELKYPLHQLLIKHGKTCPRCRAATGLASENWAKGCVIEHLVKRYGAKKGGDEASSPKKKGTGKGKK
ncbi:DNA glycosylase, partial [Saccharata proteae CBS 121410]